LAVREALTQKTLLHPQLPVIVLGLRAQDVTGHLMEQVQLVEDQAMALGALGRRPTVAVGDQSVGQVAIDDLEQGFADLVAERRRGIGDGARQEDCVHGERPVEGIRQADGLVPGPPWWADRASPGGQVCRELTRRPSRGIDSGPERGNFGQARHLGHLRERGQGRSHHLARCAWHAVLLVWCRCPAGGSR
jgi:hypothetical protein